MDEITLKSKLSRTGTGYHIFVPKVLVECGIFEEGRIHCKQFKDVIDKCDGYICFAYGHGAKNHYVGYKTISWFFAKFRFEHGYTNPYDTKSGGQPQYRHASHVLRAKRITDFIKEASKVHGANAVKLAQQTWGHAEVSTTLRYSRIPNVIESSRDILNNLAKR